MHPLSLRRSVYRVWQDNAIEINMPLEIQDSTSRISYSKATFCQICYVVAKRADRKYHISKFGSGTLSNRIQEPQKFF